MKILTVLGTRPEAIKMASVIGVLHSEPAFESKVCVTAQHRQMLDQVLDLFPLHPDFDLDIMQADQDLSDITSSLLLGLRGVYQQWQPDIILVHGDTTTTFAASLSAYYAKIKVGHVEAGLRTYNKYAPWPEEINRSLTGRLADIHFAPTSAARENLILEGVERDSIHITGNTVVDTLLHVVQRLRQDDALRSSCEGCFTFLDDEKDIILVTGHRRENFGKGVEDICRALVEIARRGDVQIVYPLHLNPKVQIPVRRILSGIENIKLIDPLDYLSCVYLMDRSKLIITDSGGIQEEAPSLGKPVLVMRERTERPEAVEAGTAKIVGTDPVVIINETNRLLDDPLAYKAMSSVHNPYGDGSAAIKIRDVLKKM